MFIDRGMDKENVAYVHTHTKEYYSAIKKRKNAICSKWMHLEIYKLK